MAVAEMPDALNAGRADGPAILLRPPVATAHALAVVLGATALIAALLAIGCDAMRHWFLLPVMACGCLVGLDAWDWLRGRLDLVSPAGILGMLGYHFFFLAPLLHVRWDYWVNGSAPPPDWRDWLGLMAIVNLAGLVVYRLARTAILESRRPEHRSRWRPAPDRLWPVLIAALLFAAAMQFLVYRRFGGLLGFIQTFTESSRNFQGLGPWLVIGESFPILAMLACVLAWRRRAGPPPWAVLIALFAAFFALQLLFGGLRGSRSNVIWALFWAAGLIHLRIRRLPRIVVPVGLLLLVAFMLIYSFYKGFGSRAIDVARSAEARASSRSYEGRPVVGVLLSDFGRSDVQAYVLYHTLGTDSGYRLAWGQTYFGTLALLVPRGVFAAKPPIKTKWGTEILYGQGVYDPGTYQSSRIFGLAGEAMLNFGLLGIPAAFGLLGFAVGGLSRLFSRLSADDIRWLMFPLLTAGTMSLLINDSDVVLFFMVKNGFVPFTVLLVGSRRAAREPLAPAPTSG